MSEPFRSHLVPSENGAEPQPSRFQIGAASGIAAGAGIVAASGLGGSTASHSGRRPRPGCLLALAARMTSRS